MFIGGILTAVLVFGPSSAYRFFQEKIPNGDNVPHPCKPNFMWWGVGHKHPQGGGERNQFGKDFHDNGKRWTQELCRIDSDGDGLTNGQELGDPACTWTEGQLPSRTKDITHPGFCDPWGSATCQEANKDVTCDTGEFECEGLDSPDVFNVTLRMPPTPVPAKETTYICFTFELDMLEADVDYHLIAVAPYIDNPNVMHHSVLTSCDASSKPMTEPAECNMAASGCQTNLAVWTLGMAGDCVHKDAGFKISRESISRLTMQHHWTNPELRTDYVDSSGLVLYLTKKLRKYDAAYFTIGEIDLEIPPAENRVVATSTCSSSCTRKYIRDTVYLMTGLNHMHYLGYQQNVELFRDGRKVQDLTPDEVYSYDNPKIHEYDPLVELRPGDSLQTTCVYRSLSRTKTTTFGQGTFDEMCFGIFTYFPAENIQAPSQTCLTHGDIEFCQRDGNTMYNCNFGQLFNATNPETDSLMSKVLDNCVAYGVCRKECPSAIAEAKRHPCFSKILDSYTRKVLASNQFSTVKMVRFVAALQSCDDETVFPVFPSNAPRYTSGFAVVMTTLFMIAICH